MSTTEKMLRSIRICLQSQPVIVDPQLVGMSFMNVFNTLTEKDPTHAFIESAPRGPGLSFHADSLFVHSDHLLQEESGIVGWNNLSPGSSDDTT